MNTPTRHYKGKDVEMLTATSTLVESAITNKAVLQAKRSNWADPYFEDLQTKIDNTIQTYLGVDSAKLLRGATQALYGIQAQALLDLTELKVQLQEDFKKDKTRLHEILKQLGYTDYFNSARHGDQEGLISLLFSFKTNLTADLQAEITAKGTMPALLTGISGYADVLKNSNISQETFKGSRKTITAEAIAAFNDIYDEVIGIGKISANLFKTSPDIQSQFQYAKLVGAQNSVSTAKKPKAPAPIPA